MKNVLHIITGICFTLCIHATGIAQVGVKNSDPKGTVDVAAADSSAPTATDGILVPRIDAFPASNPGVDQDGMMAFFNSNSTPNYKKRHHYWDNNQGNWLPFGGEWLDGYNSNGDELTYVKQALAENDQDVVIYDNGRMGFGTDTPEENIEIKLPGDNDLQITSTNVPNAPNFHFVTYNGTFASRDFLNDDDVIGEVAATAWDGSGRSDVIASITSLADGDHSSGNLPSKFNLSVTAAGDDNAADSGIEMTIEASGNVGIGNEDPTAGLDIKAGTATAGSAPVKLNSGTNLSTTETGAFEYDGTHLYFTESNQRNILLKGLTNTQSLNFLPILPDNSLEITVLVLKAPVGASCNCTPLGPVEPGLKWSCYISALNMAKVRLTNVTAGVIDPAPQTWKVTAIE